MAAPQVVRHRVLTGSDARLAFMREAYVGAQVHRPFVAEVIDIPPERQSRLYVAMPHYPGDAVEQRLRHGPVHQPRSLYERYPLRF